MSLVQCPECSSQISSKALMCLSCGFPISKTKALSFAILLKDSRMISNLIRLGADVNSADEDGRTPLMFALVNGDQKIVNMLLQAGASESEQVLTNPQFAEPELEVQHEVKHQNVLSNSLHEETSENSYATESVGVSQARRRAAPTKFFDDEELPEEPQFWDGLVCLHCGAGINPDDVNCSHCKTLIMRRYCSHCSKLIPDHASICPLCNRNVKEHFLYSKLRRAKILIGVGAAAIFVLVPSILIWQHLASEKTSLQADVIGKPEVPSADTKSIAPQTEHEEIQLPASLKVQEIAPPSSTTKPKFKRPEEVQKPVKNVHAEEPVESKVEMPQRKPLELPKLEDSRPELAEVEEPAAAPVLSAAAQRVLELKTEQRIRKGRFLNSKGYNLIKEGRPSDAIPVLRQSLRSFPKGSRDVTYAYALFNLAVAYRMAGRPDIAIPILEERIKINNQRDVVERELLTAKRQARLSGMSESQFN